MSNGLLQRLTRLEGQIEPDTTAWAALGVLLEYGQRRTACYLYESGRLGELRELWVDLAAHSHRPRPTERQLDWAIRQLAAVLPEWKNEWSYYYYLPPQTAEEAQHERRSKLGRYRQGLADIATGVYQQKGMGMKAGEYVSWIVAGDTAEARDLLDEIGHLAKQRNWTTAGTYTYSDPHRPQSLDELHTWLKTLITEVTNEPTKPA